MTAAAAAAPAPLEERTTRNRIPHGGYLPKAASRFRSDDVAVPLEYLVLQDPAQQAYDDRTTRPNPPR
jgi:hypothetical protein